MDQFLERRKFGGPDKRKASNEEHEATIYQRRQRKVAFGLYLAANTTLVSNQLQDIVEGMNDEETCEAMKHITLIAELDMSISDLKNHQRAALLNLQDLCHAITTREHKQEKSNG